MTTDIITVCDDPAPADSSAAPSEQGAFDGCYRSTLDYGDRTVTLHFKQSDEAVAFHRSIFAAQPAPVSAHVATVIGNDHVIGRESRGVRWVEGTTAFDFEPGTKLFAAPVALTSHAEAVGQFVIAQSQTHKDAGRDTFMINCCKVDALYFAAPVSVVASSAGESLSAQVGRLTDELRRAQTLHFNYVYEVSRIASHEDSICNFPETDKVREWITNLTEQVLATHRQPEDSALIAAIDESALRDGVIEGLVGLLGCGRTWSAWQAGTMTERDFYSASESDECIDQVVDAIKSRRPSD